MNEHLISIVVPVYNVKNYLKRCVDSILDQTYSNLEIILVDDGSTDESGKICDSYADLDERVSVIHKTNGGLSDARNAGLEKISGEYVIFIDSDDFVSPFYVENRVVAIQKTSCKIACSGFVDFYEGKNILTPTIVKECEIKVYGRQEFYAKMLLQDGVDVSAWGKIYYSQLFDGVRYPVGKLYEDIPTTYLLVEKTDNIAVIPNVDYYYFQRKQSISKSSFNERKMDAVVNMARFRDFIIEYYPALKVSAITRYFSIVCNIFFLICENKYDKQKNFLWAEIKKYRRVILFNKTVGKKARLAALISFFGWGIMKQVYRIQKHNNG